MYSKTVDYVAVLIPAGPGISSPARERGQCFSGLDDQAVARVRQCYLDALARDGVTMFRAAALIGLGTRGT